ncbi:MAG: sugar transferase, partial [Flammeovirgaceae bacterium]
MVQVKIVVGSSTNSDRIIKLDEREYLPTYEIAVIPLDEPRHQLVKRIFDIIFSSLFCLLVLSWLLPLVAFLIKIDSKGSIFFIQKRNGLKNALFDCIKFRTMVINQESDTKQATKDDARITKVGKFLRKSSID